MVTKLTSRRRAEAVRWAVCMCSLGFAAAGFGGVIIGGDSDAVFPADPAALPTADQVMVSYTSGKTGTLTINGGSLVQNGTTLIGWTTGSNGTATVTGAGSTWTNSRDMTVGGGEGTGALSIADGGTVSNSVTYIGYASGTGSATITGSGSSLTNSLDLYVGFSEGSGSLTVTSGATVNTNGLTYVGFFGGSGSLTVTSGATVNTNGLTLGYLRGNGSLSISGGGRVNSIGGDIGFHTGSIATMAVSGTGSYWDAGDGVITIGRSANGTLVISDGAIVSDGTGLVGSGSDDGNGGFGSVTVTGTGSRWTNSGELYVGGGATGILNIRNGGTVSNTSSYIRGSVVVDGADSTWNNSADLIVGYANEEGTLTVSGGGRVTSGNTYLGWQPDWQPGGTGSVTVTGPGSALSTSGDLYVGYGGLGKLQVAKGASVSAGNLNCWSQAQIAVEDGASLSSSGDSIFWGSMNPSTITVKGKGAIWSTAGRLDLGNGTLTINPGAKVTARSVDSSSYASTVNLRVGGNDMLVVGDAQNPGQFIAGTVNMRVDAFLPAGRYHPISEASGGSLEPFSVNAVGGSWDWASSELVVPEATQVNAGEDGYVVFDTRLIITDPVTHQHIGLTPDVSAIYGTFNAVPMDAQQTGTLLASLGDGQQVLSAWDFPVAQTYGEGSATLLSFDVGLNTTDLQLWHYAGGEWSLVPTDDIVYRDGIASVMVDQFSGYAITGVQVPEPAGLGLVLLIGCGVLRRHRA